MNVAQMNYPPSSTLWSTLCLALIVLGLSFVALTSLGDRAAGEYPDYSSMPIIWPMRVEKCGSGYVVAASYRVNPNTRSTNYTVMDSLVLQKGAKSVALKYEDLEEIPDDKWRRPIHPQVYKIYPQPVNVCDAVHRLLQNKSLEEPPMYDVKWRYLSVSRSVCHPDVPSSHAYDIVVVVKSSVLNFSKRQWFRRIYKPASFKSSYPYLQTRYALVFSIGLPGDQTNKVVRRGNVSFEFNFPRETLSLLEEEIATYDDIVLGDYEDDYFNVSIKLQHEFIWVATFCRIKRPIVLFVDDDAPFSDAALIKALFRMTPERKAQLLHGRLVRAGRVHRFDGSTFDKWGILKSEAAFPTFPLYPYGIYILVSYSNVEKLTLGMLFTKRFTIDDAWLGLVADRLNMHFRNIHEILSRVRILLRRGRDFRPVDMQWNW